MARNVHSAARSLQPQDLCECCSHHTDDGHRAIPCSCMTSVPWQHIRISPGAEFIIQPPPPCHGFNLPCCRVTGTPGNLLPPGRQCIRQPASQTAATAAAPTAGAAAAGDTRLWLSPHQCCRLRWCCKQHRRVCHRRCSWWQRHDLGPRPRASRRWGHRGPRGRTGTGPGRRRTGSGSRARSSPSAGRRVGRCGRAGEGSGPRQGAGPWS